MVRTRSAGNVPQPGGGNDYFYKEKNFQLLFAAQLELVTQAIICNAAPIIGLMPMYAKLPNSTSPSRARPAPHHTGLSHTMYQANTTPPYGAYNSPLSIDNLLTATRTPFATAQKWFMTQLVTKVVSVLATTDDPAAPGTKVLDNTLIYLISEIGDGRVTRASAISSTRRRRTASRWSRSASARARSRAGRSCSSRSRRRTRRRWSTGPPPICT